MVMLSDTIAPSSNIAFFMVQFLPILQLAMIIESLIVVPASIVTFRPIKEFSTLQSNKYDPSPIDELLISTPMRPI